MVTDQATDHAPSAVVLLSGGLDSATVLAIARAQGFACHALSFDYSQRHGVELAAARRVATHLGAASHRIARLDVQSLGLFAGSALTGYAPVPKDRPPDQMSAGIPVTYVPARNTVFLSYALALAEVLSAGDIFLGVNAVDYSGYPDCRPQYLAAFQAMANLATKAGVEGRSLQIHAPLLDWTKVQIIQKGLELGVDYSLTHSCYDPAPDGQACGHCDACLLRQAAFQALGRHDPALSQGRPKAW
ncbi:MAG: 7-cyano-7-deazaguanine synthase QueC [Phycisphaeraceae bacterium]|nr:7-cyano-7-deazaguanine synthase QueC [Phycisphaeraceae bacterium]